MGIIKLIDTNLFTAVKRLFHGCEKIVSQL